MDDNEIPLNDALRVLAFMGDLSMGQPVDHSSRAARLAVLLAEALGLDSDQQQDVSQIALLRWSGCTANASEVAELISDDVAGRAAMLALQMDKIELRAPLDSLEQGIANTSAIHCEVSGIIAASLGLRPAVAKSLNCIFEAWDGSGRPRGLCADAVPLPVMLVAIAGDLEIFSRVHGLSMALELVRKRADSIYPRQAALLACEHAERWLADLAQAVEPASDADQRRIDLSLMADVIDLKLPWLTGHSRAVAQLAAAVAGQLNLPAEERATIRRAGLLHGIGRVAIPNAVWNQSGPLSFAQWERVRLNPYWTSRALSQISSLAGEAEISSYAYERLNGSGYFRAARQAATPIAYRILPAVGAWLALGAPRPWRDAFSVADALRHLGHDTDIGRFDQQVVAALGHTSLPHSIQAPKPALLSTREIAVLRCISHGQSNKQAAITLGISPSTVRTHMESVFRKLECNSRAAATLKASCLGLLDSS